VESEHELWRPMVPMMMLTKFTATVLMAVLTYEIEGLRDESRCEDCGNLLARLIEFGDRVIAAMEGAQEREFLVAVHESDYHYVMETLHDMFPVGYPLASTHDVMN